jgi:HEAT repeat protein
MQYQNGMRLALAAGLLMAGCQMAMAERPKLDPAGVDKAFEALKTFDWGKDYNQVKAIDDAVVATQGDATARKELETRLAAVLKTNVTRGAKDYVCRKLMVIGTAESVPTLAGLLGDKDLSHMARYALERNTAPEAVQALRDALPKLSGALKIGLIASLGKCRDGQSIETLKGLLGDSDTAIACSAADALGVIGTPESAKALAEGPKNAPECVKHKMADSCLACAERLLAEGKKGDALTVYKSLVGAGQSKQVRLAATRGILAAGK